MALTREQRKTARTLLNVGTRRRESRKEKLAALVTALTEANLGNPNYGDSDSLGWRQERAHYGSAKKRLNVKGGARRFYDETSSAGPTGSVGELAQAVQRSAFPDRYQTHVGSAKEILRAYNQGRLGKPAAASYRRGRRTRSTTRTIPGTDLSAARQEAKLTTLMAQKGLPSLDALLGLKQTLDGLQDVPARQIKIPGSRPIPSAGDTSVRGRRNPSSPDTPFRLKKIARTAKNIDRKGQPYRWGGGHGSKPSYNGPWDCSGAVSAALGLNPRVSDQFASWGRPGRGRRVTVYANSGHVLMEVNGKFWGTSGSNPGGGAGWIPRSAVSKSYLAGFTARHPKGM